MSQVPGVAQQLRSLPRAMSETSPSVASNEASSYTRSATWHWVVAGPPAAQSWPNSRARLSPQQRIVPSVNRAQAWWTPAAMAVTTGAAFGGGAGDKDSELQPQRTSPASATCRVLQASA